MFRYITPDGYFKYAKWRFVLELFGGFRCNNNPA